MCSIAVLAGDISPIDVIAHLPILCEDSAVPYVYVPSKEQLGAAGNTKRPTSCVLLRPHASYQEAYDECHAAVKALPIPM